MANRTDLAAKVHELAQEVEGLELNKGEAKLATGVVLEAIEALLVEGETIGLVGFGTFEVRERAARKGRNPSTGEEIDIAASKTVGFKAGKPLKDKVNA